MVTEYLIKVLENHNQGPESYIMDSEYLRKRKSVYTMFSVGTHGGLWSLACMKDLFNYFS